MKRHFILPLAAGIISFSAVWFFSSAGIYNDLEARFLDYRFRMRRPRAVNPNIVIAAVDDGSVRSLGRWPWPRKLHAAFLSALSYYPPKAVGFDILFTEPEEEKDASRSGDAAMAYYSRLLGNVVYAAYVERDTGRECLPVNELLDNASAGFINVPPDTDGIIRKIPLVLRTGNGFLPSFSLQLLCAYMDISFRDAAVHPGKHIILPGGTRIPIDKNGSMWINYAGDQHAFREIAFHQVLSFAENPEKTARFAGTILLAGVTATGIGDEGDTPVANTVPLVTVHANALNTILNRDFLFKAPYALNLAAAAAMILLSLCLNSYLSSGRAAVLSLLLLLGYAAVNVRLFDSNIYIDMLGPAAGCICPFILITVYRYGWEERRHKWIKKVFSQYLSGDVIDEVMRHPDKLKLGGELKTATVLYLDIRDFSGYCEKMSPPDVVSFLNKTFDWMTGIILRHGGMLDKYIGDAIMAIFGAPAYMPQETQAENAVTAAVEIVEKWCGISQDMRRGMDIGIGINTGEMLVGNMGSSHIFNYTAVGDEVNIAARIQALTARYGSNIIVTDAVFRLIVPLLEQKKITAESLGETLVKGRTRPVRIYRIFR